MSYSIPNTVEIPLTKGYVTVVDECDGDLSEFKWHARVDACGLVYASRSSSPVNGKRSAIGMHRVILGRMLGIELSGEQRADHKDGDGTNNVRSNLRLATPMQNCQNIRIRKDNTSGVIGVSFNRDKGKWTAHIHVNGKQIYLGKFIDIDDAILARRRAEVDYFGEFSPTLRTQK